MGSNSRAPEKLDKDSRKRLEKLASQWTESQVHSACQI